MMVGWTNMKNGKLMREKTGKETKMWKGIKKLFCPPSVTGRMLAVIQREGNFRRRCEQIPGICVGLTQCNYNASIKTYIIIYLEARGSVDG
jgi:hypothetical protein